METTMTDNPNGSVPPSPGERNIGGVIWLVVALVIVLITAAVLRIYPLQSGFPNLYRNPEERIHIKTGLGIAQGDLNPHWFAYPSLRFYLLGITLRLVHGKEIETNPLGCWSTSFALTSRSLSLVIGLAGIVAMFLAGRALAGNLTGLLAALLTAVNPLHLAVTTGTSVDASLSTFFCFALWRLVRLCQEPTLKNTVLAGVFAGLALSSKQPALPLFFIMGVGFCLATWHRPVEAGKITTIGIWLLTAILCIVAITCLVIRFAFLPEVVQSVLSLANLENDKMRDGTEFGLQFASSFLLKVGILAGIGGCLLVTQKWSRDLLARLFFNLPVLGGLAAGVLAFLFTSPFMVIEYPTVIRQICHMIWHSANSGSGDYFSGSLFFFQQLAFNHGFPWLVLAIGFGLLSLWRRTQPGMILGCTAVIFFLAFAGYSVRFDYYLILTTHAIDLMAAAGVALIINQYRPLLIITGSAVCFLLLFFPICTTFSRVSNLAKDNTLTIALQWMEKKLPMQAEVVRAALTPQTEVLGDRFITRYFGYDMEKLDWTHLQKNNAKYILLADSITGGWKAAPHFYHKELARYQWIHDQFPLLISFEPSATTTGPKVFIFCLPDKPPDEFQLSACSTTAKNKY